MNQNPSSNSPKLSLTVFTYFGSVDLVSSQPFSTTVNILEDKMQNFGISYKKTKNYQLFLKKIEIMYDQQYKQNITHLTHNFILKTLHLLLIYQLRHQI